MQTPHKLRLSEALCENMKNTSINLCNDALQKCELLISRKVHDEIHAYINKHNEWGVGIEFLIDELTEREIEITSSQFQSIESALNSMGLSESSKLSDLKGLVSQVFLTPEQAYSAMYSFLEEYYQLTKSDDIGGLLGSMSVLPDGGPADAAILEEWNVALSKAMEGKVDVNLSFKK